MRKLLVALPVLLAACTASRAHQTVVGPCPATCLDTPAPPAAEVDELSQTYQTAFAVCQSDPVFAARLYLAVVDRAERDSDLHARASLRLAALEAAGGDEAAAKRACNQAGNALRLTELAPAREPSYLTGSTHVIAPIASAEPAPGPPAQFCPVGAASGGAPVGGSGRSMSVCGAPAQPAAPTPAQPVEPEGGTRVAVEQGWANGQLSAETEWSAWSGAAAGASVTVEGEWAAYSGPTCAAAGVSAPAQTPYWPSAPLVAAEVREAGEQPYWPSAPMVAAEVVAARAPTYARPRPAGPRYVPAGPTGLGLFGAIAVGLASAPRIYVSVPAAPSRYHPAQPVGR